VVTLLIITLTALVTYYRVQLTAHQNEIERQAAENYNLLDELQPPTQISTSPNESFEHTPAIKESERIILRKAAIELKGRFSQRTMTPLYFSDTRWREIRTELLHVSTNGVSYAEVNTDGSISLTDAGYKWLGINPPAPLSNEKSPETQQNTEETHHTTPQHTEGDVKND
jgi:hypothetical protein